jgi:hypothetical protein
VAGTDGRDDRRPGAAAVPPSEPAAFEADAAHHVLARLERYVSSLQTSATPPAAPAALPAPSPVPTTRGPRYRPFAAAPPPSQRADSPLLPLVAHRHSDLLPRLRRRLVGSDTIRPLHVVGGLLALAVACALTVAVFSIFGSIVAVPTAVVAVAISLTLRDGTVRTGFVLGIILGVALRVLA